MANGTTKKKSGWLKKLIEANPVVTIEQIKFAVFMVLLGFIYITNHLDAEKKTRRIADLTNEIQELNYEHISTQSELMNMSKQSEVLRRVNAEGLGLKELTEPPRIIE